MNFKELKIKFLSSSQITEGNLHKYKIFLFNLFVYFSLSAFLVFGLKYLYNENFKEGLVLIGIFILISFIKILFPPQRHYKYAVLSFSVIILLFLSFSFYFIFEISEIWFFTLLYPLATAILLRPLKGLLFSLILLLSIVPSFFINQIYNPAINFSELISFSAIYSVIYITTRIFYDFHNSANSECQKKLKVAIDEVQEKNEFRLTREELEAAILNV